MERGTLWSNARPLNIAKTCSPLLYFDLGGKEVLWFTKPSFLVGVRRGKGLTSGSKVGEGVPEAFLRGIPYIPALGGWGGRSALLPPAPC